MKNGFAARVRVGLYASSAIACAMLVGSVVEARCVNTATGVVCDASPPNPETNGATGSQISVLPGAVVQLDDPFAGAAVRSSTIDIFAGGTLTTSAGSQIYDVRNGGTAVNAGSGVAVNHAGSITARRANARGVLLGQNSSLAIAQGGVIETLASGSAFPVQNASAAVAIGGTGTRTLVNGAVRSFGNNAPAIATLASGFFGPVTSPATITIGSSGSVSTNGSSSTAIAIGGGSTLSVGGSVAAAGVGSSAITYQVGTGDVTIGVLAGGNVSATQAAAITGTGANVALRIAGTVGSGTATAISLGSGADRITLETGARVTGIIDGGAGTDALLLTGSGTGAVGSTANIETLTVAGGSWTVSGTQIYSGGTTIRGGATEIGTGSVLNGSFANAGTLQFDQATNSTFFGTITGAGQVGKSGAGTLTMGAQGYGGATDVTGGTLALTGNLASGTYAIASGAMLTSGLAATITTAATPLTITNSGMIANTNAIGRAISIAGGANARTIVLTNNVGATITSADDAFRVNFNPTGGSIRVDNYGTIQTTNGGQALDFDAVSSSAAGIVINNYASGVLRSIGQDAIRPGQGAVVTNAGLIYSDGATGSNYDGIDWQGRSGTVINQPGGTISGLRHGITSDVAVNVTNAGTILGRNGAGIGSDGNGTVVNTGTITGQWDGVAANGDGDGVDIDFIGSVTNSGIIQGLSAAGIDSGGRPNSAEGVAMGGGMIVNDSGALIFGAGNAVLVNHDTNPGGVADGATTITNAGMIRAITGRAVALIGDFADTITNSGTITGGTAGAIDLGGGDDTLNLLIGSVIIGTVDGGAGNDQINLGGAGGGSFAGAVNVEALAVNSGSWTLAGPSVFANGTSIAAPATLIGNAATLTGTIADAGTLVFDQASDGHVVAVLTGAGQLTKMGAGTLTIGDQAGFTGRTTVGAGQVLLAGTLPSIVTVSSGATVAGNGTVAGIAVATGGTLSPGQAGIGTITVTSGFSQAAGSTYAAQIGTAGLSDRIVVGGAATIASGALLSVTRDAAASAAIGTRYTLLTATGGVAGTYTLVQTLADGIELRFTQTGSAVFVDVARSSSTLGALAANRNQAEVAGALAALGTGNGAYVALTLNPDDIAVRNDLGLLSGEVHASLRTTMLKTAQAVQDVVRARLLAPAIDTGVSLWAQAMGQNGTDDGGRGAASVERQGWGGFGGIDVAIGKGGRVGLAGGYTRTTLSIDGRSSAATLKSKNALVYAETTAGPIAIRSSLGYAWIDNAVRRTVASTGYAARLASRYDGNVVHGQVELGLPHPMMGGIVEPFVGIEYYRVETDGFRETGGDTALTAGKRHDAFAISTLGIRGQTPIVEGLSARSRIGWQYALDRVYPRSTLRFASGTVPFSVTGAPLSRDAAAVALDLAWTPTQRLTITSGYAGFIGGRSDDSIFRIMGSLAF